MTNNFCSGVCLSSARKWDSLHIGTLGDDVKVMTRKNVDDPGEPPGIVLSAATSVWIPVSGESLFNFLRDERLRSEWDILSNGGPMQEMVHIAKGQGSGNCVSLLRASVSCVIFSSVFPASLTFIYISTTEFSAASFIAVCPYIDLGLNLIILVSSTRK